MNEPEFVDAKVLARRIGFPYSTILRFAREGKVPHLRLGGRIRFKPDEVIKALRRKA
ncbi:helix-turn-helix domain-containing protein [Nitrospira sp. Nam74]